MRILCGTFLKREQGTGNREQGTGVSKRPDCGFAIRPFVALIDNAYFLKLSSTATATATVAPTIGLLPIPIRPIIST